MTAASGTVIRYAAGGAAGRRRFDDQEAAGDEAFGARMAAYLGGDACEAVSAQTLLSSKLVVISACLRRGRPVSTFSGHLDIATLDDAVS